MKKILLAFVFAVATGATTTQAQTFRLQLLHSSDMEAGVPAITNAPHFAALADTFQRQMPNNTLILSAGDNYIPSPFFNAASDPSFADSLRKAASLFYFGTPSNPVTSSLAVGIGRADIMMMNIIGYRASAIGNHEFDAGPNDMRGILAPANSGANLTWMGTEFPYLSSNLVFTTEPLLSSAYTPLIKEDTAYRLPIAQVAGASAERKKKIAPATFVMVGGQRIGIVGATTQIVPTISSTGAVGVKGGIANNMDTLARYLQPYIDSLVARGINKIIVLSHLQQIQFEKELLTKLRHVDVIVAGGSHTLMADRSDSLRPGDARQDHYPYMATDLDGKPTLVVSTDGEWKYLGRLMVDFDSAGQVMVSSLDSTINGAYAADSAGLSRIVGNAYGRFLTGTTKGGLVSILTRSLDRIISAQDGAIFGKTAVYLEGRREFVRRQETNLGNLSNDANIWYARRTDPTVRISIKNGGGIRTAIGAVVVDGSTNELQLLPPQANPRAGKQAGDVSQLDILNSLRFNNALSLVTVNTANLVRLLNNGVSGYSPTATPGAFPQVGGLRFSFDPSLPAGSRVRNVAIVDSTDRVTDSVMVNGVLRGDTARTYRVVTLNFLAGGGDGYPFPTGPAANRIDLNAGSPSFTGQATFAPDGTEQDAFAEYLAAFHRTTPFAIRDTTPSADRRVQNLSLRSDQVFAGPVRVQATFTSHGLRVYPNPASAGTFVEAPGLGDSEVRVADAQGHTVFTLRLKAGGAGFIPTGRLRAGMYFVTATGKAGRHTGKLIVR